MKTTDWIDVRQWAINNSYCYHVSGKDAEGQPVTVQVFATNQDSAFFYANNMRPDCIFNNAQIQIP